jgi:4a-hydroxytetrahydrobiopterin dehydratase
MTEPERPPLSEAQIEKRLSDLKGWTYENKAITKTYKFKNFTACTSFACAVGIIAEGLDHHPEIVITWGKVKVSYNTHSEGYVVTAMDFQAAEAIEALGFPKS